MSPAPFLERIERELTRLLTNDDPAYASLYGMLRYHLGWVDANFQPVQADTGKRIRALLTCYACAAVGGEWTAAVSAAAGIELVHNFSLIHDDIEDDADERRLPSAVNAAEEDDGRAFAVLGGGSEIEDLLAAIQAEVV